MPSLFSSRFGPFGRQSASRRSRKRGSRVSRRWPSIEALEPRRVLAAPTFDTAPPTQLEVLAGAPLNIALNGFDADGDALIFSAVSENPGLVDPLINNDNRSLRITVRNTDPADPFQGDMVFELFEERAPLTTSKIIEVAEKGDVSLAFDGGFDGMIFHRVAADFVIQTGDPTGTGAGGALPMAFDDEFNPTLLHTSKGILSMANSGDDTNNSQFFITDSATRFLDTNHAVFGFQTEGDAIREMVQNVPVDNSNGQGDGRPLSEVILEDAEVFLDEENGVLSLVAPHGMTGTTFVTVTVSDGNEVAIHVIQVTVVPDIIDTEPFLAKIDDVETTAGVPVILQLEAIDPEGDPPVFDAISGHPNVTVMSDQLTGEVTITPESTIVGVVEIHVGVQRPTDPTGFDTQSVPVFITPTAPSGIEVVGAIDGPDGPITDNNNGLLTADRITFHVSGIFQGTSVFVVVDPDTPDEVEVARFTAPAPTDPLQIVEVEFNSNGPLGPLLADGQHVIAVRQEISGTNDIGNNNEFVTLVSDYSNPIILTVDTTAPVFESSPAVEVVGGSQYTYDVETDEEDGVAAIYTLVEGPDGMTINPQTGVIVWSTIASDVGTHSVVIRASDALGNFNEQSFDVEVINLSPINVFADFDAIAQTNLRPPDPIVAVGPDNMVALVNPQIALYERDGTEIERANLEGPLAGNSGFFDEVANGFGAFDPWVTFDRYSQRYIVLAEEVEFGGDDVRGGFGADEANMLIAISTSAGPDDLDVAPGDFDDDWHVFQFPGTHNFGSGLAWLDYPKIAADADSIYVTANYFRFGQRNPVGTLVTRFDKAPMLDGIPVAPFEVEASSLALTLQPAESVNRPAAAPQLFVSDHSAGQGIVVWELDDANSLTTNPTVMNSFLPVGGAPQMGTTDNLDVLSPRMMNAVWRDGSIWTAHTVEVGGDATVRWYEIDQSMFGQFQLAQTGDINPGPDIHTFMPHINVDASGNMGITYTQSGPNQFADMMVTGRRAGDAPGTTEPGVVARNGQSQYTPNAEKTVERWGDYAGIDVDPLTDHHFWAYGEFPESTNDWNTHVTGFTFGMPPDEFEPNDTLATATMLGALPKITLRDLTIHDAGDVDFFKITAQDTGKLVINAFFVDALGNIDIRVRDMDGNVIGSSTTTNDDEQIIIPAVTQEMYFLEVSGFGDDVNAYKLEIENFANPAADLVIAKIDTDDPVTVGDDVTYTVTVTNNGPDLAESVVLTDTLPAGVIFVSATAGSEAGGVVTANLGDLADGASVDVVIVVTTTTMIGTIINEAEVNSDTDDPDSANNVVSEDTMVEPVSVEIDIKPGSDQNPVNLKSRGVLSVAILTTDNFDALQVDLTTVVFGDAVLLDDGAIGVAPLRRVEKDVDRDGDTDLMLKFSMRDLVDNGALGEMSVETILTGETFDGAPFEGNDSIRLVPPGRRPAVPVSSEVESSFVAVDRVLGSTEMNWALYMLFDDLLDEETDE